MLFSKVGLGEIKESGKGSASKGLSEVSEKERGTTEKTPYTMIRLIMNK